MTAWFILAVILFLVIWVRIVPSTPEHWHVDPDTVEKTARPNQFLMRDAEDQDALVIELPAEDLAAKFNEIALSEPKTTLLAGSTEDLWLTYVQRTKVMSYPDYISVKFTPIDAKTTRITLYSRSRFGRSDLGVNKARIKAWLTKLPKPTE